jgi:imidazolonepropionase-like amidohydrolase
MVGTWSRTIRVATCARPVQDRLVTQTNELAGLLNSNVRVFDTSSGAFSEPAGILIRDGRIHAVGLPREVAKPKKEINARGAFALPALWDSHVHLSFRALEGPDAVRECPYLSGVRLEAIFTTCVWSSVSQASTPVARASERPSLTAASCVGEIA